jgi:hypothetical protein
MLGSGACGTIWPMRRSLTWLVAIPLMLAGSQAGHVLAYRWMYPEAHVRVRELLATGHSYMDYAPFVLGFAGAVLLVSLLVAAADSARGRTVRALPPWAFALLPPLAFTLQEHIERWLHTGVFPWFTALGPTFLPGLLLQLPFGIAAYLVARFLLRAAERLGRALAPAPPPRTRVASPLTAPRNEPELPRRSALASQQAERGPPLPALT